MGCLWSRNKWEQEERLVLDSENCLKLNKKHCKKIVSVFHRMTKLFHLNLTQFESALRELKIETDEETMKFFELFKEDPNDSYFFNNLEVKPNLKGEEYLYSVKKLSVLAIFFGKGNTEEKINALFNIYDIDLSKRLSLTELGVMLKDIGEISLHHLPRLATVKYPNKMSEIMKYSKCLSKMEEGLIEYFKYLICGFRVREITLHEFVEAFEQDELQIILNAAEIRNFAIRAYEDALIQKIERKKETNLDSDDIQEITLERRHTTWNKRKIRKKFNKKKTADVQV
ncbi:unnamed protein product [Blepharisma stoltei]|uniref:EF-hand domain-containing protein n=1 Tax=Blepharisma stoltei TaxID=1481888 RepID=A0AAU9ITJ7_9CILI|nr:unnamed protein product [Blepharisma stoltei]